MGSDRRPLRILEPGRISFQSAYRLQRSLLEQRIRDEIEDHLLILEHEPVVTVGRGTTLAAVRAVPFSVVEVERGGEATYHGPGQLVGYPILKLAGLEKDLNRYLRNLEEVLIRTVADFGIAAVSSPPHTGVWVGAHKIASIGVAVRRWVTYHGFALNVSTDLSAFRSFRPCGLAPTVMANMRDILGADIALETVADTLVRHFGIVLGRSVVRAQEKP